MSSRRTKTVSLSGMEMFGLVLLTFRVLSTDSLLVRNRPPESRWWCKSSASAGTTWERQHLKLSPFNKACIVHCLFFFFLPSCFPSKLRRWIASCSICFWLLLFWVFFHCGLFLFCVARKKKPHCTVLLGMATTLLPKHFVKQVVTWTLKTEKERLHSWQHLLGDTMILWNACQNMELTLMQQIRLVMGEWFTFSRNCLQSSQVSQSYNSELIYLNAECQRCFLSFGISEHFLQRIWIAALVFKIGSWLFLLFFIIILITHYHLYQSSPYE